MAIVQQPTNNYQRYTEGYYYLVDGQEFSQDELRAAGLTTVPGNPDFAQGLIFDGVLVPRLYTQQELLAWGGPPGGWTDYQSSIWASDPERAMREFLARVPSQYLRQGTITPASTPTYGGVMTGGNVGIASSSSSYGSFSGGQVLLDGEITRSSLPTREIAGQVRPLFTAPSSGGALVSAAPPFPWLYLIVGGAVLYFLARQS